MDCFRMHLEEFKGLFKLEKASGMPVLTSGCMGKVWEHLEPGRKQCTVSGCIWKLVEGTGLPVIAFGCKGMTVSALWGAMEAEKAFGIDWEGVGLPV